MTAPLDAARVGKLLLKIEAGLHRSGWDNPDLPKLVALERTTSGLRSVKVPVSVGEPAGEYLLHIANMLARTDELTRTVVGSLATPTFYGTAFITEAWMIETTPDVERSSRPRYLKDDPTSIEVRSLMAITVDGHIVFVLRKRGQKPQIQDTGEHGGKIASALLAINKIVAAVMPDGAQYLEDLNAVVLANRTP